MYVRLAVLLNLFGINSPRPSLAVLLHRNGINFPPRHISLHGVARPLLGSTFRLRAVAVLFSRRREQLSATQGTGSVAQPRRDQLSTVYRLPTLNLPGAPRLGGSSMDRSPG